VNEAQMRTRVEEIDARLPQCRSELLTLADGDLGETETARFDELETEHGALTTEREQLAARLGRIDQVRETARTATAAAEQVGNDERNRSAGGRGVESGGGGSSRATRLDPFENLDAVRSNAVSHSDLQARALTAIEQGGVETFTDEQRERATQLVQRGDRHGRIARHMLMTGSDAYVRAFGRILEGAQPYQLEPDEMEALRFAESHRASMAEGSGGTGGFLVPFYLDPTVFLTNASSTNPFRQISRVETITGNAWHGVSSAGVVATWLGEAVEATNNSPAFIQPAVNVFKAGAYLQASFEVTQDTNVVSQIGMMLADAKDNLEATAFAVGSGTNQPKGVVTAVSANAGSVVPTTANTYTITDVYNVKGALPPRHRPNASWVANELMLLATRQFATGSGPQHAFWADLGMATPSLLLGRPVYESSAMDGSLTGTANDYFMLVGDFKNYLIVDRIGMTVQYEPLVMGPNRMPTGEVGWFANWRVGADCLNADAFRVLNAAG
jgi:HK97 family phage major capsid protein